MAPLGFTWSELGQQIAGGLSSGAIFALLALALVIIYRSTRVINFAQGEMAMFSVFVAYALIQRGMPFWGAFFLTLAISFLAGVAIERTVIRPVEERSVLAVVIVTLGLALVLNGLASVIWGGAQKQLPPNRPFPTRTFDLGGVAISIQDVGIVGVALVLVTLLFALFQLTKLGLGLRAAALNPDESRLVGVRVGWMLALGWGLAAAMGAVAGVMAAASFGSFDPNLMQPVLLYAFAAAILGGIDSPLGAVAGGLVLGVALNLLGRYVVDPTLRLPVALGLILLLLLVRPNGLFGRAVTRRV